MKETELKNTSETSEMEVQNLSGQDKARKHRKTAKAAISFIVMIVLLVALFFAAVNIGSLKVSFPELLKGLFVKYNEDVATIYDLRFPRIVISMLAGSQLDADRNTRQIFDHILRCHACMVSRTTRYDINTL